MTEEKIPKAKDRVRAGANLLRQHAPDWYKKIDPKTLDINDPRHCVLAQVFGEYRIGYGILGLDLFTGDASKNPDYLGFGPHNSKDMLDLAEQWIKFSDRLKSENP